MQDRCWCFRLTRSGGFQPPMNENGGWAARLMVSPACSMIPTGDARLHRWESKKQRMV